MSQLRIEHGPPVVSVITACDSRTNLRDLAAALRGQTLQQWEWAIVDDGSTGPAALAELGAPGDRRVRVVEMPEDGPGFARGAGVAATSAPLLFFLDGGGSIAPTALEKLAWLLHSDERPAFATAWCEIAGAAGPRWPRGFETREGFLFENMATPLVMMRRAAFEAVGGFDEARALELQDHELWLRCAARGYWGRDIPEYLLRRRQPSSASDPRQLRAFRREMRARYPELYRRGLPSLPPADDRPFPPVARELPFENRLPPEGARRLIYLLPQLDMGGVSTFALAMLERLTLLGYRCTIVATMPHDQPLQAEFERFAEVFVPHRFLRPADYPRFLRYLIRSRGADAVLNTNSLLGYRLLPYLRAHCPGVALIDYNHMRDPGAANQGFPGFSADSGDLLDMHLASSDDLRAWMIDHGAPPERAATVYTAADTERWRPDPARRARVRAELGLPADTPVILHAARITAQKQPQLLARVLLDLARQQLPFHCLIAGDGPDMAWLRGFVREHRLESRVRLLGAVPADRMPGLMSASDILFLPSAYEGLALTLFEAMASGVVPVTVDTGGQRELVTPGCGILVPLDERQEARYAAALAWLLRSPRQRHAMAAASRRRVVEHFNVEQLGAQLDRLIGQACITASESAAGNQRAPGGMVAAAAAVEELRQYQRNHRFRAVVMAWEWWKRRGGQYAGALIATRASAIRRTYPLRSVLRRVWLRVGHGKR